MNKRSQQALVVTIVLLGMIVVGVSLLNRVGPFPAGATRIPGTENTLDISTPWRSAHEVFVYDGFKAAIVDTRNGIRTPVPAFGGTIHTGMICFSPNGRWLLWASGTDKKPLWRMVRIGTYLILERPRDPKDDDLNYADFLWLHDSQRWAERVRTPTGTYARVYHVNSPRIERVTLSPGEDLEALDGRTRPVFVGRYPSLMNGPGGMTQSNHILSPNGDRVAWLMCSQEQPLDLAYYVRCLVTLHRIPHSAFPRYRSSLWVSRSDGSNAHKIGTDFASKSRPVCLNWTPDGTRLSFNYDNALWIVPANRL